MKINFNKKYIILGTFGAFFAFFLFGFVDNLKGPTIPVILRELNMSYGTAGFLLLAGYLGFFISVIITGPLSECLGNKTILILGALLLSFGAIGYSFLHVSHGLFFSMFFIGLGIGSLDIGGNGLILDLHNNTNRKGKYLSLLGFSVSLGSALGSFYAGQLLLRKISWRTIYFFSIVIILIFFVYIVFLKYEKKIVKKRKTFSIKKLMKIIKSRNMIVFSLLICFCVSIEVGIAAWLIDYLHRTKQLPNILTTSVLSFFFIGIMVGRFLFSFFVEKIGYIRIMIYLSIALIIAIFLLCFGPNIISIFFPIIGILLAPIFPTTIALFTELTTENIETKMGILFSFVGIGGMLGPWSIGFFSEYYKIGYSFTILLLIYSLVILSLIIYIKYRLLKNTIRIKS